jgi:hypothetical protein
MADRKLLFAELADAQRLVTLAEESIRAQKRLIAELDRDGRDSASAREVLTTLIQSHAGCVEKRDEIREQLSFR